MLRQVPEAWLEHLTSPPGAGSLQHRLSELVEEGSNVLAGAATNGRSQVSSSQQELTDLTFGGIRGPKLSPCLLFSFTDLTCGGIRDGGIKEYTDLADLTSHRFRFSFTDRSCGCKLVAFQFRHFSDEHQETDSQQFWPWQIWHIGKYMEIQGHTGWRNVNEQCSRPDYCYSWLM